MIRGQVLRHSKFPFIAVGQQFLLVVEEFFTSLGGKLKIRSLHDCIHRASLLTESAIDTFCHINVISCCSSAAVRTGLRFDGDRLNIKIVNNDNDNDLDCLPEQGK